MPTFTIANTTGLVLPGGGIASQTLAVRGFSLAQNITITLHGLTLPRGDDFDMLLVAPDGRTNLLFWSDAGGIRPIADADITITRAATAYLPDDRRIEAGLFRPAAYDGQTASAAVEPRESDQSFGTSTGGLGFATPNGGQDFVSAFQNAFAQGDWQLIVAGDNPTGADGRITGWELQMEGRYDNFGGYQGTAVADRISIDAGVDGTGVFAPADGPTIRYSGVRTFLTSLREGDDVYFGSEVFDIVDDGGGRDKIMARGGDDWILVSDDGTSRELFDGGDGTDLLFVSVAGSSGYVFDLRHDRLRSIEKLGFDEPAFERAPGVIQLRAAQFGEGLSLNALIEGSGFDEYQDILEVSLGRSASVDLGALRFQLFADRSFVRILGDNDKERIGGTHQEDVINGRGGADRMSGYSGDDTYYVDDAGDRVIETVNRGVDHVISTISLTLDDNIENLTLAGRGRIDGTGNRLDNAITGNDNANVLAGGRGDDTLTGGGGRDVFVFSAPLSKSRNVDVVTDFDAAQDTIHLAANAFAGLQPGRLAASAFHVGDAAAQRDDRIVYDPLAERLFYDADGSDSGAAVLFAILEGGPALNSGDFIVV